MFDIGFWELLLVAIIGLLVLGPERLPAALRSMQRGMQGLKSYGSKVSAELNHELRIKELHEHLAQAEQLNMDQLPADVQRSIVELKAAAAAVQRPYANPKPAADDSHKP
ncbi:Sec-independent protein translocase protein TatB [Pseudidiomarina mangrovi]|uniref:Sec-independent protein translocase protein TatB n=1 Tax=Pseudidiomarina mangrovi TaxID=2487133 RepID=UPI000FCBFAAB|nr:Sec-independent protein translocase protein TatB [Pseudidiomarina mangrovi]